MSIRLVRSAQRLALSNAHPRPTSALVQPVTGRGFKTSIPARAQGGSQATSGAARAQSENDKRANLQEAQDVINDKLEHFPETLTSDDAAFIKSREARYTGQAQPPSDSLSAEAERVAARNEADIAPSSGQSAIQNGSAVLDDAAQRSQRDRLENFAAAVEDVLEKEDMAPDRIDKEDARLLQKREDRVFQHQDESPGIAKEIQKRAAENERKGSV